MPKNNNLKPVELPMTLRFGEEVTTKFKNNLDSIRVTVTQAPSMRELRIALPAFAHATWSDYPMNVTEDIIENACEEVRQSLPEDLQGVSFAELVGKSGQKIDEKLDEIFYETLMGRALPTALETVRLTFAIEGISLQEVTHILRYRTASFSAECSGDKWWTHKNALVPNAVQQSDEFFERYQQLMHDTKVLYQDMIDSKQISIMDARYILPRGLETFYFMSMSLKDCMHFIRQRIDKQIQPETDNILAYQMMKAICDIYPLFAEAIDIRQPSHFYVKTARTGRATNLYFPDADSDLFEYNENDFIYQATRDELNGTNENATNLFNTYLDSYTKYFLEIKKENREKYSFLQK